MDSIAEFIYEIVLIWSQSMMSDILETVVFIKLIKTDAYRTVYNEGLVSPMLILTLFPKWTVADLLCLSKTTARSGQLAHMMDSILITMTNVLVLMTEGLTTSNCWMLVSRPWTAISFRVLWSVWKLSTKRQKQIQQFSTDFLSWNESTKITGAWNPASTVYFFWLQTNIFH